MIELRETWLSTAVQLAVEIHIRKDLVFNSTDSLLTLKEKASGKVQLIMKDGCHWSIPGSAVSTS